MESLEAVTATSNDGSSLPHTTTTTTEAPIASAERVLSTPPPRGINVSNSSLMMMHQDDDGDDEAEDISPVPEACLSATSSPGSSYDPVTAVRASAMAFATHQHQQTTTTTTTNTTTSHTEGTTDGAAANASSDWMMMDLGESSHYEGGEGGARIVPRVVSTLSDPQGLLMNPASAASLSSVASGSVSEELHAGGTGAADTDTKPKDTQRSRSASTKKGSTASKQTSSKGTSTKSKSSDGTSSSSGGGGGGNGPNRRQKRLERNRESARLSRRRRKQYLEVLEESVTQLGQEMDQGRREHVAAALETIRRQQLQLLQTPEQEDGQASATALQVLEQGLSWASQELRVVNTFQAQQLKCFVVPGSLKFVLWMTLQNEPFFRGGRAASERLSAARIGERMLSSGTELATPAQCMWPLFCNEVGLSYDQEEKVRAYQRTLLQSPESWLDRHAAYAASRCVTSIHDAVQAVAMRVGQRAHTATTLLHPHQRWALKRYAHANRARLAKLSGGTDTAVTPPKPTQQQQQQGQTLELSSEYHVAANLYILNSKLQSVLDRVPRAPPLVTGAALKKLLRRPSFESLSGSTGGSEHRSSNSLMSEDPLSRENSFASCGSLKRSASEMSMDGSEEKPSAPTISPMEAQAAAAPLVQKELGFLQGRIPPPATTVTYLSPVAAAPPPPPSMGQPQHVLQHPGQPQQHHPVQQQQQQQHAQQQHYQPQMVTNGSYIPVVAEHAPLPASMMTLPAPTPVVTMSDGSVVQPGSVAAQPPTQAPISAPAAPFAPTAQYSAPPAAVSASSVFPPTAAGMPVQHPPTSFDASAAAIYQNSHKHARKSSFLPPHLNVVPEEMWPADAADDLLLNLVDEDWAIGEGVDMDT